MTADPDLLSLAARVEGLSRDEMLVLLVEEAGEVVQAATKCLRFGFDRDAPGYGHNGEQLAKELGELHRVAQALGVTTTPRLNAAYARGYADKIERAMKAKILALAAPASAPPGTPETETKGESEHG